MMVLSWSMILSAVSFLVAFFDFFLQMMKFERSLSESLRKAIKFVNFFQRIFIRLFSIQLVKIRDGGRNATSSRPFSDIAESRRDTMRYACVRVSFFVLKSFFERRADRLHILQKMLLIALVEKRKRTICTQLAQFRQNIKSYHRLSIKIIASSSPISYHRLLFSANTTTLRPRG